MTDFHGRIMNLQPDYAKPGTHLVVYKRGFRDARHVAAEVGLEADALLVRLAEAERDGERWRKAQDMALLIYDETTRRMVQSFLWTVAEYVDGARAAASASGVQE
jgi:hypothetical protein